MCGRYTLISEPNMLAEYFQAALPKGPIPINYNAKPAQLLPIILEEEPNKIIMAHWGYPIHIGKGEKEVINTRIETLETNPFFQKAAQGHRCIILANGFYEWVIINGKKVPYLITVPRSPIAFAGIYKFQKKKLSDDVQAFFSIITSAANPFMMDIHDRMPVILNEGQENKWLQSPFSLEPLRVNILEMKAEATII